tara:strand:- start:498 stop:923 length:426 start_codon:yes stop_codon:yes gene_type:complete
MKSKSIDKDPCVLTIQGEPASKANSRRLVSVRGKPMIIKSQKALLYKKGFELQCPVRKNLYTKDQDLMVAMKIFYKSRRPDLDESLILDLLQGFVYENDRQVKLKYIEHGLDKENPRTSIVISTIDNKDNILKTFIDILSS